MPAQAERHPREFWKRLVAELARGATLASTAARHGVRPRTLSWWRWRLRREEPVTRLLPVVLRVEPARVVAPPPSEPLSIEVRDDITFRIPVGANIEYVAALVTAVRNSC